jgi:hypothetical protein
MSLAQLFSLEGKVAIVSGGTSVLGGALARGRRARGHPGGALSKPHCSPRRSGRLAARRCR